MNFKVGCRRESWLLLKIKVNLHIDYLLIDGCLVDVRFDSLLRLSLLLLTLFDKLFLICNNQIKSFQKLRDAYALGIIYFEHFT